MNRLLAGVFLTLLLACGGPDDSESACAPLPSPAPTGDAAWQIDLDEDLLEKYQSKYPETFAGAWVDNARKKAVLAFTDDPKPHVDRLREKAQHPELIDVVQHPSSRAQLTARADRISEDGPALKRRGIELVSVGVEDRSNRIFVGVREQNPDDAEYLCTLYGEEIMVQQDRVPSSLPSR